MPNVSPITKSPVTRYLINNKYIAKKGEDFARNNYSYFYGENGDYLGEMVIHPKGIYDYEISKLIFKEKLQPVFREYTQIKNKMATFWSKHDYFKEEFLPIASTTTRVTIDLQNKTQTKTVIERVLEQKPKLIQDAQEKFGIKVYKLEGQKFKYKIESVTEETKPYKWNKYNKYNIYM